MPVTLSPEETYIDEWKRIAQDEVKRVAFERKCIEDALTDEKRVILLQENPSSRSHCRFWDCVPTKLNGEPNIRSAFRFNVKDFSGRYYEPNKFYHVSCMEQIFPYLSALVERGGLQMEGGVTQSSAFIQDSRGFASLARIWGTISHVRTAVGDSDFWKYGLAQQPVIIAIIFARGADHVVVFPLL
ncbi:hypothetical protein AAEP93_010800 [Penicillium crustosum]